MSLSAESFAQTPEHTWPIALSAASATTGSTDEQNLLLLQLANRAPLIQTGTRSFSAVQLDTLLSYIQPASHESRFAFARPSLSVWYNAQRTYSENDGVVWVGRGLTTSVSGGGVARLGPITIALRPVAFWTQNRPFQPELGAIQDTINFANPAYPGAIDLPYRFGNRSYGRIDPGESSVQLDTRFIVAGISTATQVWGPMHIYPLLLGPNAGGFPHVLLGTGLPWNIGIGQLSARSALGRLDPSAFAPSHPGDPRRLASEFIAEFTPAGLDGVEIGGGRFFHRRWPTDGVDLSALGLPFEALLKGQLPANGASPDAVPDNQLASVFFRIVRPKNGFEVYGEFLRDDNSLDINDLVGEPDHESAYALGLRKLWLTAGADAPLTTLTLELVNGRISHLAQLRSETPVYLHNAIVEGHTERGQLLGSPAAFGGTGYSLEFARRRAAGGWTVALRSESVAQNQEGGTWNGTPAGFESVEVARIWSVDRAEITVGADRQIAWNSLTGSNFELTLNVRPVVTGRRP